MTRIVPWAGWIGGLAGWLVTHQLGSDFVQTSCNRAAPPLMLLIALIGALAAAGGALLSLSIWRRNAKLDPPAIGTRRFIAGTGVLAAALFLLAILIQVPSSLIIPRCFG